jgi:hypothetical protein
VPFPPDSRQQQARLLRRALALLLQLQFHPATEAAMELRQCLSVFFDVFTAASGEFRLQLVAAALPAARQALHVVSKKNPAALLVKYVLQLLQATDNGGEEQQQMPAGESSSSVYTGSNPAQFAGFRLDFIVVICAFDVDRPCACRLVFSVHTSGALPAACQLL